MEKYEFVDAIEKEDITSTRNIEITKINALIFIANELAEMNHSRRLELERKNIGS